MTQDMLHQTIFDAIRHYLLTNMQDDHGCGYPLIDAMTNEGQPVTEGIEQCRLIADDVLIAVADFIMPPAPSQDREKALEELETIYSNTLMPKKEGQYAYDVIAKFIQSPRPRDELTVADYEECMADQRRLVRELDVALNGEQGAAKQASLCDIVSQVIAEGIKARPRDGYVLVPVEPTINMLEVLLGFEKDKNGIASTSEVKAAYALMLAAAPKSDGGA